MPATTEAPVTTSTDTDHARSPRKGRSRANTPGPKPGRPTRTPKIAPGENGKPLRRGTLVDDVSDRIAAKIASGNYAPGDRLPNLEQLAEEHGVGRSVAREAIRGLAARGLVEVQHGEGTFVRAPKLDDLQDLLSELIHLATPDDRQRQLAVMDIRTILEPAATALAAERATGADISELSRALLAAQKALDDNDGEAFFEADVHFHTLVARASHNPVLILLLDVITPLLRDLRRTSLALDPSPGSNKGHEAIFAAIARRNVDTARLVAREHLNQMIETLNVHVLGLQPLKRAAEDVAKVG